MSEIGEVIRGAAQGGPFPAREREAGDDGHTHEAACLNCGATLNGAFCHACGQKAHVHRTMRAIVHDLLHGALHFEGRTWATLPLLVLRPGELTRRYIAGEHARFVSPMALFLFSVFLMFAVFQLAGLGAAAEIETRAAVEDATAPPARQLEELREARARLGTESPATALIDRQIATLERRFEQEEPWCSPSVPAARAVSALLRPVGSSSTGRSGSGGITRA